MPGPSLLVGLLLLPACLAQLPSSPDPASPSTTQAEQSSPDPPASSLVLVRGLRNTTREAGGSLKLRCEVEGDLVLVPALEVGEGVAPDEALPLL